MIKRLFDFQLFNLKNMTHIKDVKKKGEIFGHYLYETKRINGGVITNYLRSYWGKNNLEKKLNFISSSLKFCIFLFILIFLFFIYGIYFKSSVLLGPSEGIISLSLDSNHYTIGDKLRGKILFSMKSGELIPEDSKIRIVSGNVEKMFFVSDYLRNYSLKKGKFYIENIGEFGEGEGYGLFGKKEKKPIIKFNLIVNSYDNKTHVIEGNVSKDSDFIYYLEENESIRFVKKSIIVDGKSIKNSSSYINFKVDGLRAIVSTNYSYFVEGFGSDFFGKDKLYFEINLDASDIKVNGSNLRVELIYENISLDEINAKLDVDVRKSRDVSVESNLENEDLGFVKNISTIRILKGNSYDINLDSYFVGADRYEFVVLSNDISYEFKKSVLKLIPNPSFSGAKKGKIIAYRKNDFVESNDFLILVSNGKLDVKTSLSEKIVVGKPVKWSKRILKEKEESVKIELPKNVTKIKIKRVVEGIEEDVKTNIKKIDRSVITGNVIESSVNSQEVDEVLLSDGVGEYVIEYETEAPKSEEVETEFGKRVVISASSDLGYSDVLAFSNIKEKFKVGEEDMIKIYWKEENKKVDFDAYDLDGNGFLDYVEWIVPHLSNQTFEIILITKAERLNSNRSYIEDIYNKVREKDGIWKTIGVGEFVRVKFEKNLTMNNDITLYAKGENSKIFVYEEGKSDILAEFNSINGEKEYKVYLDGSSGVGLAGRKNDVFDLEIYGGNISFDLIVDPTGPSGINVPVVNFIYPTPSSRIQGNGTFYVNISTYDPDNQNHYSFVDINHTLIGWWRFDLDEDYGETPNLIHDWSGNGYDGVVYSRAYSELNGSFNRSYYFDRFDKFGGGYVEIGDVPPVIQGSNQLTISAWARLNDTSSGKLAYILSTEGDRIFSMYWGWTQRFLIKFRNNTQNKIDSLVLGSHAPRIMDKKWHHIVGTYNGDDGISRLYIDGSLIESSSDLSGRLNTIPSKLSFGTVRAIHYFWNGSIDEVMIFNRELGQREVLALYNSTEYIAENNITGLKDGVYDFMGYVLDDDQNMGTTESRQIEVLEGYNPLRVDSLVPLVNYTKNTYWNNSYVGYNWIRVGLNVIEDNFARVVYRLVDSMFNIVVSNYTHFHFANNLRYYTQVFKTNNLIIPLVSDVSSISYDRTYNSLFLINNLREDIYEIDLDGNYLRTIDLTGFDDTEGIYYINTSRDRIHTFAIAEERRGDVRLIFIDDSTTSFDISNSKLIHHFSFGDGICNTCLEGISYNPDSNVYYAVKQSGPKNVYMVNVSNPNPESILFDSNIYLSDLADLSDIYYDSYSNSLYIVSQVSRKIVHVNMSGWRIDELNIPDFDRPEGVSFDKYLEYMFVAGEPKSYFKYKTNHFYSGNLFSGLGEGVYYFNSTTMDYGKNYNWTFTRKVILDLLSPDLTFIPPTPKNYSFVNKDYVTVSLSTNDNSPYYSFVDFNKSLLFWLRFDENDSTNPFDISSFRNSVSYNEISSWKTGFHSGGFGKSRFFNGDGDYVEVPGFSNFNFNNISVSLWFEMEDSINRHLLGSKLDAGSGTPGFILSSNQVGNNDLVFFIGDGTNEITPTTGIGSVSLNKWHHVVATFQQKLGAKIYLDGVLKQFVPDVSIIDKTSGNLPLIIGSNNLKNGLFWNGSIDEILIFDRAISDSEVLSLYNSTAVNYQNVFSKLNDGVYNITGYAVDAAGNLNYTDNITFEIDTVPPIISFDVPTPLDHSNIFDSFGINVSITEQRLLRTGYAWDDYNFSVYNEYLVLMMNFDKNPLFLEDDSRIVDFSIYSNNGSFYGTNPLLMNGKYDNAYDFDGIDDYIDVPYSGNFNLRKNISVGAWVYFESIPDSSDGIVVKPFSFGLRINNDASPKISFFVEGIVQCEVSDPISVSSYLNEWHYFMGTFNTTDCILYRDGSKVSDDQGNGDLLGQNYDIFIGSDDGTNGFFDGIIDNVRIWNKTLTDRDIDFLYRTNMLKYNLNDWSFYVNQLWTRGGCGDGSLHSFNASAYDEALNINSVKREIIADWVSQLPKIKNIDPIGFYNVGGGVWELPVSAGSFSDDEFFVTSFYEGGWFNLNTVNASFTDDLMLYRSNLSCKLIKVLNFTSANYSCTTGLWYFDHPGPWKVQSYVNDSCKKVSVDYFESFIYESMSSVIHQSTFVWEGVDLFSLNSVNSFLINNSGNTNVNSFSITAQDLLLNSDPSKVIPRNKFLVDETNNPCNLGQSLSSSVDPIFGFSLGVGNNSINSFDFQSGQGLLYFCLTDLPSSLPVGSYIASGGVRPFGPGDSWEVTAI